MMIGEMEMTESPLSALFSKFEKTSWIVISKLCHKLTYSNYCVNALSGITIVESRTVLEETFSGLLDPFRDAS